VTQEQTVAGLGERALVRRIRDLAGVPPPWVLVGIGDDAAVVAPVPRRFDVLTTDALVEGVHFDFALMQPADVGARALAANLSDLAAMGAEPRTALLSLGLPPTLPVSALDDLVRGVMAIAVTHGVAVIGGNITRTMGPLFIDVTATGAVHPRKVLRRSGARPGDEVYVSGSVGGAAAGLMWLRAHPGGRSPDEPAMADAVTRYRRPEPRVRLGLRVGRTASASACMDLSDGLADAVGQIADASGVGMVVDAGAVPLHAAVSGVRHEQDAVVWAAAAGEDYELAFTVPRRRRRAFLAAVHGTGTVVTRIGEVTRERGVWLRRPGSDEPMPAGFLHFA
jgi:thiamine-monophosphate kinase